MTTIVSSWGKEIPGPAPTPVLGLFPLLLRFAREPLGTLEKLQREYGDLIRLENKHYPVVMVFGAEYNRQILRDPSSFYSYDLDLVPVPFPRDSALATVTTGMPLMNGPRHNDHRSALLPYFHRQFITRYHDASVDVTEKKLQSWQVGDQIDLRSEMEQLAMWLATAPVLGLDPVREGDAIGRQLERVMKSLFDPMALLFPYDIPGLPYYRLLRNGEHVEQVVRRVIAQKRKEGINGDDILSVMLRMHDENPQRLTERELIGHTSTMFRGGYNPNGMVLYWAIFLLAQHPEILEKVLLELDMVLGGANPVNEQLDRLDLLEGVIKETMRLFPAGTWTARLAMQAFELEGHCLPKGTWIVLSPYITQRMPELFPEPYKFVPERWFSIHPSAYEFMPFSAGPRYCIGSSLGIMQLKIALSMILRRYRLTLRDDQKLDYVGINAIRPKHGLPMTVDPPRGIPARVRVHGNIRSVVQLP